MSATVPSSGPPFKASPSHLPPLTHECVKLIDPEELVKLLSTTAIKAFQEDSLKTVTSDVKDVEKILKPVASARPELLKHLGADPEGDNPCSLLEIQKVVKEYPLLPSTFQRIALLQCLVLKTSNWLT